MDKNKQIYETPEVNSVRVDFELSLMTGGSNVERANVRANTTTWGSEE